MIPPANILRNATRIPCFNKPRTLKLNFVGISPPMSCPKRAPGIATIPEYLEIEFEACSCDEYA